MRAGLNLCLLALLTGCGDAASEDPLPTPGASLAAPPPEETPGSGSSAPVPDVDLEKLDRSKEKANASLEKAAREGDRSALRAAERRLDRASRRARAARTPTGEAPDDPLTELLATFPYKEAPLFVQQTTRTTEETDHRLFASVLREQFCLKSRGRRLAAVRRVFETGDGYLRARGATDFELIVTPMTDTAPVAADALATAAAGDVRLTRKGRECRG